MITSTLFVLNIALVLLVGIIAVTLAERLRITHTLPLLIGGGLLSLIRFRGEALLSYPPLVMEGFASIAFAMVAFDAAARARLHRIPEERKQGLRLSLATLIIYMLLLTPALAILLYGSVSLSPLYWLTALATAVLLAESGLDTVALPLRHRG